MKRSEKVDSVTVLRGELKRATVAVLAEYRGLTAGQMTRFRKAVREVDGRCRVAKNTLAKRAVADSGYQSLESMLQGPRALIVGFADPVAVAKVAITFADEFPKLEIKGAVVGGQLVALEGVRALATLPPREVILAQLLGLLQAPATQLLRTLNEPAASLARLVDAIGKRAAAASPGDGQ